MSVAQGKTRGRPRKDAAASAATVGKSDQASSGAGVQSIRRAFAILEEIARTRDGVRLADLSKRVGLHNSTTFHLVRTMVSLGYIRQMEDNKSYRIGRPLFMLAASAFNETQMVSLAIPILEELSNASGETSHFAVWTGDNASVLARTTGPGKFQYIDRDGVARPAYATALGKVLLAALRPKQLDDYLERTELVPITSKTIVDPDELRNVIDQVRSAGVAFDDGEIDEEVRCVAVPVLDFSGNVAGAIGISAPHWRMKLQQLQDSIATVQSAAARLSHEFGSIKGNDLEDTQTD